MGHCKFNYSLCNVQQVWWNQALGAAATVLGRGFMGGAVSPVCADFILEEEAALSNHSAQSPASV